MQIAKDEERGTYYARKLREWTRAFIEDRECLPFNVYGTWQPSLLEHEDLAQELHLYLQTKGKYVRAQDLVDYLDIPEVKTRFKLKRTITERTAQRWMHKMGYRWTKTPSGQYVDGHERKDVVDFRQKTFLPGWHQRESRMRSWTKEGIEEESPWPHDAEDGPRPFENQRHTVAWFQDESTFYANDLRETRWVHEGEKAVPRPKGQGSSLMVSDFISADFGFLASPDGTERCRVLFRAGSASSRDGWYTNEDMKKQTERAMEIYEKHYPQYDHVFIFDNATTHTMPKNTPKDGKNWGVEVPISDGHGPAWPESRGFGLAQGGFGFPDD